MGKMRNRLLEKMVAATPTSELSTVTLRALCEQMAQQTMRFTTAFRHQLPQRTGEWHRHDALELVYHLAGRGETRYGKDAPQAFAEGSIVICPPGLLHSQTNYGRGEDWCVLGNFAGEMPELFRQPLYVPAALDEGLREDLRLLSSTPPMLTAWQQAVSSHRLTGLLLQCVVCLLPSEDDHHALPCHYVTAAEEYLARHYAEIQRMEQVAEHLGISYDYLRHLFRQQTGISLIQYLTAIRIERAKHLVCHSTLSMQAIAQQVGLDNERYFSTIFRAHVGQSPGRFRREYR